MIIAMLTITITITTTIINDKKEQRIEMINQIRRRIFSLQLVLFDSLHFIYKLSNGFILSKISAQHSTFTKINEIYYETIEKQNASLANRYH